MDATAFDRIARALVTAATRRDVIGALAGVLTGAAGLTLAAGDASAKNRHRKGHRRRKRKRRRDRCRGKQKCGKACIGKDECCTEDQRGCPYEEACVEGGCVNCLEDPCDTDGDCCTDSCFGGECRCWAGRSGPPGGCTSDRQCCNGFCEPETSRCACDPNGAPCVPDPNFNTCCSGFCNDQGVCAQVPVT